MSLDAATAFRLYYDSEAPDTREDPDAVRDRVSTVAERRGIDYRETDVAALSDEAVESAYSRIVDEIDDYRDYVIDTRVLSPETFASKRPTLVVEYGDGRPADVYPRRIDDDSVLPVGVLDFCDEVQPGYETDRPSYRRTPDAGGEEGAEASDDDAGDDHAGPVDPETFPVLGAVTRAVARVVPV